MKTSFLMLGAVLATTAIAPSAHATQKFWVNNRSGSEITNVYLENRYGEQSKDLLGGNGTIPPQDIVQMLSTSWPGCRYDVRVLTDDGQFAFFPNFNTCKGPLNVNNKGLSSIEED